MRHGALFCLVHGTSGQRAHPPRPEKPLGAGGLSDEQLLRSANSPIPLLPNSGRTSLVDFVKSRKTPLFVIPAKAGIQYFKIVKMLLDPGFHRGDDFLRDCQVLTYLLLVEARGAPLFKPWGANLRYEIERRCFYAGS